MTGTKNAMRRIAAAAAAASLTLAGGASFAQTPRDTTFPSKPIRWLVGFAPGGGSSILSRLVAQKLNERWQVPVVVDNRAGAAGGVAMQIASASAADGTTVLVMTSSMVINSELLSRNRFVVLDHFAAVTQMTAQPYVLLGSLQLPARSVEEIIALARKNGGRLNYGSSGTGSVEHLGMELFKSMAGIQMNHVPYKGAGQTLVDLLGGHIDLALSSSISATPHVKSGKLRGIAVTSPARLASFPDLPTVTESGLRGYEVVAWYGLVIPKATPRPVVDKLNAEIGAILATAEVKDVLASSGAETAPSTPQAFQARIVNESRKWAPVVKSAGVQPE